MRLRRRGPFHDVIERQLGLFERECGDLLCECERALAEYDAARGATAEERYGRFVELADDACDALRDMREAYASTLPDGDDERYRAAFTAEARRQLPRITLGLD